MNDTDRLRFVETIQRLQNWMQRTRLSPAEFLSAGSNRELFDELVQPVVAPLTPRPAKPAQCHRRRRPWRQWADLSAEEQDDLLRQMARRRATQRATHPNRHGEPTQSYLARRRITASADYLYDIPFLYHASKYTSKYNIFASFPSSWINKNHRLVTLPEGTPAERIHHRRSKYLRSLIYSSQTVQAVAFIKDCHPDDVEFDSEHVVAAQNLMKLQTLFLSSDGTEERPLAATLFLTDPATGVQVYYCALLRQHRSEAPTLERAYLGRAFNLAEQRWLTTARFKRASNALAAALKIYGEGVAARIQPSTGE